MDVLGDGDRIIDQGSQSQNQRKEGDAVNGLPRYPAHRQRARQGEGNHKRHNGGLSPAQENHQQGHHHNDGNAQALVQIADGPGRRLTIVPSNGHLNAGGELRLQFVQSAEDLTGNGDGISAFLFGNANGDGRLGGKVCRCCAAGARVRFGNIPVLSEANARFGEAIAKLIHHGSHVAQINWRLWGRLRPGARLTKANNNVAHVPGRLKQTAPLQKQPRVPQGHISSGDFHIFSLQPLGNLRGRQSITGQFIWV